MTIQEVKNNFVQNLAENAYINMCSAEEMNIVIETLEKQIPCKLAPKSSKKSELPVCGKCNSIMDVMQGELNYCPNCGQAIDWRANNGWFD